jgi:Zn-dependent peptidase ImmA (M78 family)
MDNKRWQIAKEQVDFFWSTLGIKPKLISKQYPLSVGKLKKSLHKSRKIHLIVEEQLNLTGASVEEFLNRFDLLPPETRASETIATQLAGAVYAIGDTGVVFIPRNDSESRKLFSLAHELGHFFIEILIPFNKKNDLNRRRLLNRDVVGNVTRMSGGKLSEDSFTEYKANQFAAELLMPRERLLAIVKRMRKGKKRKVQADALMDKLVEKFNVSRKAAEYRIIDLEIKVKK